MLDSERRSWAFQFHTPAWRGGVDVKYLVSGGILLALAALVLGYLSRAPLSLAGFLGRAPFSLFRRTAERRLKGSTGSRRQEEPASKPAEEERAEDALHRRNRELETLFDIARILAQPEEFDEQANRVLGELARAAQAEWATLRVPDEGAQGLRLVAQNDEIAYERPEVQRFDLGVPALAFQRGLPVVANDYPAHPNAEPSAVAQGARSLVSVPVKAGRRDLGVISLVSREPDHFTPERVSLLTAVADGLGTLLENARLAQAARRAQEAERLRNQELEALFHIARLLTEPGSFEEKISNVMEEFARIADGDLAISGCRMRNRMDSVGWMPPDRGNWSHTRRRSYLMREP